MFQSRSVLALTIALALAALLAGCPGKKEQTFEHVVFDASLSAAAIEEQHPLTAAGRAELAPESLEQLAQWQIDQLYARLEARAIPEGPWQGRFFFAEGGGPRSFTDALGGVKSRFAELKLDQLATIGESLWKGKVFFKDEGVLRNMIDHENVIARIFDVDPAELRKDVIDGREVALLFPAKLYCGESLNDPRRDSVIIDYSETDTIEGYIPKVDFLAGGEGLNIRDEIRFVRPGLYLGLAYYLDGRLLLTFTLYNEAAANAGLTPEPECWDGSGPRPEPMTDDATAEGAGEEDATAEDVSEEDSAQPGEGGD